jgi:glycosyltransferase involved in cell wall biosynthesis
MYSEHGVRTALKYATGMRLNIRYIYPGCEPDVFYPMSEEERREARKKYFEIGDKTKLFMNANRNQWRKDMGRTLMIFQEFRKRCSDSLLYMHAKNSDVGGCLSNMAGFLGMRLVNPGVEVMFTTPNFHERSGAPRELLNILYNCADALVSTTTGEGWGLCTTDAMAAQRPVIVPRNTSALEIIGENEERGYLVKAGGDVDHQFIHYGVTDNPRDIVHSEDMIRAMEEVYYHPDRAAEKAKAARAWTLDHTWAHAKVQWQALFAEIESKVEAKVEVEV